MKVCEYKQRGITTRLGSVRGFTLIEIMVAVGIISLLVGIAAPNYLDWNRKYQLREATGNLFNGLQLARMAAMNQNSTVTVTVTQPASTSPVSVTFADATSGAYVVPPLTFASGLSLTNASGGAVSSPQVVQFTSSGRPVDPSTTPSYANNLCITTSGAYTACSRSYPQALNLMNTAGLNYRIVITTTGKVSWCYSASCAQ